MRVFQKIIKILTPFNRFKGNKVGTIPYGEVIKPYVSLTL